ncbi:MAG: hypothetical protein J2P30_28885 [Actinobacteria bacterium]|nr:hypothetical protein [Actinomycetota bacterium]
MIDGGSGYPGLRGRPCRLAAAFGGGATTLIAHFTHGVLRLLRIREFVLACNRALAGGAVFQAVIPDSRLQTYLTRTEVAGYLLICPSLAHALATGPVRQYPALPMSSRPGFAVAAW